MSGHSPVNSPLLRPPVSVYNGFSAGAASMANMSSEPGGGYGSAKYILSGALTANVYKEVLAVAGAGVAQVITAMSLDATLRNIGLKVVIDGVTVFDAVTDNLTTAQKGLLAVGNKVATANIVNHGSVPFNSSLSVQVKSTLTESNLVAAVVAYLLT